MAEGTTGSGSEGSPTPEISNLAQQMFKGEGGFSWGGKNPLESFRGQLPAAPDVLVPQRAFERITAEIQEAERRDNDSTFNTARILYEYYMGKITKYVDIAGLSPDDRTELQNRRESNKAAIQRLAREAEEEQAKPRDLIRQRLVEFYKEVKNTRRSEHLGRGGSRRSVIEQGKQLGPRQEDIWGRFPELQAIYGGLAQYIWEGVVEEIDNEENGTPRPSLNPLAEAEFAEVKRLRQIDRMKQPKFETTQSWYGGELIYTFDWPETAAEMVLSAQDWVKHQIAKIGKRDPGTIGKALEQIRDRGVLLVENSVNRLNGEEGAKISEKNPYFLRARAFMEGIPEIFGNEKMMQQGNTEQGPGHKERFASEFINNHNEAYLENKYAAYEMHQLDKVEDGTFWTGQDWDWEKFDPGQKKDHMQRIEKKIQEDASTMDFFTETIFAAYPELFSELLKEESDKGKGFFELREKYHLDYGFKDPLEKMLLDSNNQIRDKIAATGDQKALERHRLRVDVFRRTWDRRNEREGLGFVTDQERQTAEAAKGRRLTGQQLLAKGELIRNTLRTQGLSEAEIDKEMVKHNKNHHRLTDKQLLELAELKRNIRRAEIQQELRAQGLTEPEIAARVEQIEVQIRHEMEVRRRQAIRQRIIQEMQNNTEGSFISPRTRKMFRNSEAPGGAGELEWANMNGGTEAYDKALWDWVRAYNGHNIEFQREGDLGEEQIYYPSGWDMVRMKINRPTKLIDRSLFEEAFEAMYERIDLEALSKRPDYEDIKAQKIEEARFGFDIARAYEKFLMRSTLLGGMRARLTDSKTGEYIGKLTANEGNEKETDWVNKRLGLIKVDDQGIIERDADGHTIAVNPDRKLIRIFDVIQARLEKAIADEAVYINTFKEAEAQARVARDEAIKTGNQATIAATAKAFEEAEAALTDTLVNAQFVATHALKEIGVVEGKLPVWSYNFLDRNTLYVFTEALADYGVEAGSGRIPIDHNRKEEFYEILERGRRALQSEKDRAVKEFMEGRFPTFEEEEDGEIKLDPGGNPVPSLGLYTGVMDFVRGVPKKLNERKRISNKGDHPENTQPFEGAYDMSTSGGEIVPEMIPSFGDTGFDPLLVWLATPSIREVNNYMKGLDEVEFRRHPWIHVRDAPANAKAQAASYNVRRALSGGIIEYHGQKIYTPGLLKDTFLASININAILREWLEVGQTLADRKMGNTVAYLRLMDQWRFRKWTFTEKNATEMEAFRQLTYLDHPKEGILLNREMYFKMYDVLKHLIYYFATEQEVEQNRITGNATRNLHEHNTLKLIEFTKVLRKAGIDDTGYVVRHKFSPEIASEVSISMIWQTIEDADYQILTGQERRWRVSEGAKLLARGLDDDVLIGQGFKILDEKDWSSLPEKTRKTLETIRRRGLLEFMRWEGYPIVNKKGEPLDAQGQVITKDRMRKVLGYEMPPLVRKQVAAGKEEEYGYAAGMYLDLLPAEAA